MHKINDVAEQPIELTANVAERIKSEFQKLVASGEAIDFEGVRFGVKKTGCSGFAYILEIIKSNENIADLLASSKLFKSRDINIYVSNDSYEFVSGTKIDYVKQGIGHVMVFDNPNAAALCGCGISFTVDENKK